ncbi:MAG: TIGR00300 family protein, partial [Halalkalicoccus sp.]
MSVSRTVELEGHIIDSGMMGRCFGIVMDMGGWFDVEEFDVGTRKHEESYARMRVSAEEEATLYEILHQLNQNGATLEDPVDAGIEPAPENRVVPPGFYSTTNHPTEIRYEGKWIEVERIEMDCAVVVEPGDGEDGSRDRPRAYTKVLNAIEKGDLVVTGDTGIRVHPPERPRSSDGAFGFMQGGVSSERPATTQIENVADASAETKARGGPAVGVAGPAVL